MTAQLTFTASPTQSDAGKFTIEIKNVTADEIGGSTPEIIALTLPRSLWGLADKLAELDRDKNKGHLALTDADVKVEGEGVSEPWTAVLFKQGSAHVSVRLLNDRDSQLKKISTGQGSLAANKTMKVTLPIQQNGPTTSEISYKAGDAHGKISVAPTSQGSNPPAGQPTVVFEVKTTDGQSMSNTVALKRGTEVNLHWEVTGGTATGGTLAGFISDNETEVTLSKDGPGYLASKGNCPIAVFGTQHYVLTVTVSAGGINHVIQKMVVVERVSSDQFGYLHVIPGRTLPYGQLTAIWKTNQADSADLELLYKKDGAERKAVYPQTLPGGDTAVRHEFLAPASGTVQAQLSVDTNPGTIKLESNVAEVAVWNDADFKKLPQGHDQARDLFYDNSDHLLLAVPRSLDSSIDVYRANVQSEDIPRNWSFEKLANHPDNWLAIAAQSGGDDPAKNQPAKGFVALRKNKSKLDLDTVSGEGNKYGDSITLPKPPKNGPQINLSSPPMWAGSPPSTDDSAHATPDVGSILSIAALPSPYFVTGGADGNVRIRDVVGNWTTLEKKHTGPVNVVAAEEGSIVSSSEGNPIEVWLWEPGGFRHKFSANRGAVSCLAWESPWTFYSGSDDGTVLRWNKQFYRKNNKTEFYGFQCSELAKYSGSVTCMTWSQQGLLVGCNDKTVRRATPGVGPSLLLTGHSAVRSIAAVGDSVAVGFEDGTIKVTNGANAVTDVGTLPTLAEHSGAVNCLVGFEGKLISGSDDKSIKIWDIARQAREKGRAPESDYTVTEHTDPISGIAVGFNQIVSFSGQSLKTNVYYQPRLALTPDGSTAIIGSTDGTVRLWDLHRGQLKRTVSVGSSINCLAITPDGNQLISGDSSGNVLLCDLKDHAPPKRFQVPGATSTWLLSLAVTADGKRLVGGSSNQGVFVWDIARAWDSDGDSTPLKTLRGHTGYVLCVAVSPDGKTIVSGGSDNTARIWDVERQECRKKLNLSSQVFNVAIVPTSDKKDFHFVTGSGRKLEWWDASGTSIRTTEVSEQVESLAVSPDGTKVVATFSSGSTGLKIFDVRDENYIQDLELRGEPGRPVAITPDGLKIVTASMVQSLQTWSPSIECHLATTTTGTFLLDSSHQLFCYENGSKLTTHLNTAKGQLVALGDAAYFLDDQTGDLTRHRAGQSPKPRKPLVDATGNSLATHGVLAEVKGKLVFFTDVNQQVATDSGVELPHDWYYDPSRDHWLPCGHGLDISRGVIATRQGPGKATRLFAFGGKATKLIAFGGKPVDGATNHQGLTLAATGVSPFEKNRAF